MNICLIWDQCFNIIYLDIRSSSAKKSKLAPHDGYQCSRCPSITRLITNMRQHIMGQHLTAGGRFKCEQCGRLFNVSTNAKSHFRKHHSKLSGKDVFLRNIATEEDDKEVQLILDEILGKHKCWIRSQNLLRKKGCFYLLLCFIQCL